MAEHLNCFDYIVREWDGAKLIRYEHLSDSQFDLIKFLSCVEIACVAGVAKIRKHDGVDWPEVLRKMFGNSDALEKQFPYLDERPKDFLVMALKKRVFGAPIRGQISSEKNYIKERFEQIPGDSWYFGIFQEFMQDSKFFERYSIRLFERDASPVSNLLKVVDGKADAEIDYIKLAELIVAPKKSEARPFYSGGVYETILGKLFYELSEFLEFSVRFSVLLDSLEADPHMQSCFWYYHQDGFRKLAPLALLLSEASVTGIRSNELIGLNAQYQSFHQYQMKVRYALFSITRLEENISRYLFELLGSEGEHSEQKTITDRYEDLLKELRSRWGEDIKVGGQ